MVFEKKAVVCDTCNAGTVTTLSGRAWFGVISSKVDDACVVKHDTDIVV